MSGVIDAAVRIAVEAEREACAEIAASWEGSFCTALNDTEPCCHTRTVMAIAAKIRARRTADAREALGIHA